MAVRGTRASRAVFVDKDGTLVRDVPFNVDPGRIVLMPGVESGMRALHDAGYRLVVVSNQPGVAMGLFRADALALVEARLSELFADVGVSIDGYFWCTHAARAADGRGYACSCRKPNPGLLETAARLCGLDLRRSWMIGDILDDVEAGHRAGCRSILVDAGGETLWRRGPFREPDAVVPRFDHAVRHILALDLQAARAGVPLHQPEAAR
jgi:D-glycero-D-manno-heptose 1,7-bisphosphate phosphatase